MRKLGATKLHELEQFEQQEGKILSLLKMLSKLDNLHQKNYLTTSEVKNLKTKYEARLKQATDTLKKLIKDLGAENGKSLIQRALSLHAL